MIKRALALLGVPKIGGAVIALLLGLAAWCGWAEYRLASARTELQAARAEHAVAVASAGAAALRATEQYREAERKMQTSKDESEARSAQRIRELEIRNAQLAVDRNRLRDKVAAYAGGPADPASDSIAAARHRAQTLGVLLAAADKRAERDARELEALNEEKRLLLEAWPR